jgi:predicted MFS family arabinose efflux permease
VDISKRSTVWLAWSMATLFYAYQYVLRVLPNVVLPDVMKKYSVSPVELGQFAGIYYIAYAAAHIPLGTWLDKKGPKYVLPACIVATVLGAAPLVVSDSWGMVYWGRILTGLGSAGAILGMFKVIHIGFPENRFSRMLGISAFIGLMGAIYGSQPLARLLSMYGYDIVVQGIIYVGLIFAVLSFFVMPKAKGIKNDEINLKQDLSAVLKHKSIIYIGIFAGLMVGPLEGFSDAWGLAFLEVVYSIEKDTAAFLTSMIFLGMAFGSSIIAYIGDKSRAYYGVVIACSAIMTLIFIAVMFKWATSHQIMTVMLFMVGIFSGYQVLTVYLSTTFVKENVVGLTTAILNMIVMSFGYLFHSVIGKALELSWDGTISLEGAKVYSAQSYVSAIAVIPVCLAIGGLGFIWLAKVNKAK